MSTLTDAIAQAADRLADELEALSHKIHGHPELGSSDIGNVSQLIPAIQLMVAIAPTGTAIHTREFAEAAIKPLARAGLVAAAKTMAMTTLDLVAEPALVAKAKEEFAPR